MAPVFGIEFKGERESVEINQGWLGRMMFRNIVWCSFYIFAVSQLTLKCTPVRFLTFENMKNILISLDINIFVEVLKVTTMSMYVAAIITLLVVWHATDLDYKLM